MKKQPTTLWIRRLVLSATGGALCLGASAQDITLSIARAAHVTWPTTTNKAYQVETSTNLAGNWTATGELIEGTGSLAGTYADAPAATQLFRVQETSASGLTWLEGAWQGDTYQASSNSVPFTTRISLTNSNRTFSAVHFNNTFTCSATLDLVSYSDTQARFYSSVQSGPCLSGAVVVTRLSGTNVLYNWYYPDAPSLASSFAVLNKSP